MATAASGKYVPEARLIMSEHLGRVLTSDELVHHVNGDSLNNNVNNLMVVSQREHRQLHKGALWHASSRRCRVRSTEG